MPLSVRRDTLSRMAGGMNKRAGWGSMADRVTATSDSGAPPPPVKH